MTDQKKHPRAGQTCMAKFRDSHGIWRVCHKKLNDKGTHFGKHRA